MHRLARSSMGFLLFWHYPLAGTGRLTIIFFFDSLTQLSDFGQSNSHKFYSNIFFCLRRPKKSIFIASPASVCLCANELFWSIHIRLSIYHDILAASSGCLYNNKCCSHANIYRKKPNELHDYFRISNKKKFHMHPIGGENSIGPDSKLELMIAEQFKPVESVRNGDLS